MIEVLARSDNPKHRNSKFLKFLKKLSTGAYGIEHEQLVKNPDKLAEFKLSEVERVKEEQVRQKEEEQKKQINMTEDRQKLFERLWNGEEELSDEHCRFYQYYIYLYSLGDDAVVGRGKLG